MPSFSSQFLYYPTIITVLLWQLLATSLRSFSAIPEAEKPGPSTIVGQEIIDTSCLGLSCLRGQKTA